MTLGERSRFQASVALPARVWGLVALILGLLLAGCSGGSGGPGPSATPTPSTGATGDAAVIGSVVDASNNFAPVADAVVSAGTNYTFTNNAGAFTLPVPAGVQLTVHFSAKAVRNGSGAAVLGGNNLPTTDASYYDTGYYQGAATSLGAAGITIPAVTKGSTYNIGTIQLLNLNGPPPPPIFP